MCFHLILNLDFSEKQRALPITASQSSTWSTATANLAIDDDMATNSNTQCGYNEIIWFKMVFEFVHCFSEVVIFQSHLNSNAQRMDGTRVLVMNSETESRLYCGRLSTNSDLTVEGQTYRIPCALHCGNIILLEVNRGEGSGIEGCIHMNEIQAYSSGATGR